jgi:glycerol dehydrogenase
MTIRPPFFPQPLFAEAAASQPALPRVFAAPGRYIQGPGVLARTGNFLPFISSSRPAVLLSAGGKRRFGPVLEASFAACGREGIFALFDGECSYAAVEEMTAELSGVFPPIDALIGVGGGKCLDAAKCVAFRLGVPVVICPTIASTDASCSAVSVMYTPEGEALGPEYFPQSPALVLVDTQVIATAPKRHLVAGMGDALATWHEARICQENPLASSMLGGRMTLAAMALAQLCAATIHEHGRQAAAAIDAQVLDEALERVIEANTLLSGIGFESGGLSIAHAVAASLTVIPVLHQRYLHGELVGIGTLTQLVMEEQTEAARTAATFMAGVGLPITLEQLSLRPDRDGGKLKEAMAAAAGSGLAGSAPFAVTAEGLVAALLAAHAIGRATLDEHGDAPFRQLHG